nr:MAG TPA: hypothetical protein [Caudoviricetes sp.]
MDKNSTRTLFEVVYKAKHGKYPSRLQMFVFRLLDMVDSGWFPLALSILSLVISCLSLMTSLIYNGQTR